ncbi:Protein TPX2 [Capsicum baccatum]|uniref:Protein TPX2 n=1 Tax=Capsicum baccatum TaxID=33114 RepID=A0A2G2VRE6_CAPBA|nr:Protein TPX2 [Capsicum baccatum]
MAMTATAITSEKKCNCSSSTFTFSNFFVFIVSLMAATKSTATATATTSEKKKPVFVKVETLKSTATTTATTSEKKKPVKVKGETLKPGSTAATATATTSEKQKPVKRKHKPELATAKRVLSDEVEKEQLEKVPKFKARPLNKKIFESKGDLGMFLNTKRQVTVPQEFHFATDKRILPPANVADELLFKAQPVLTEDPIPVPEKVRKPLTEVQDFKLRVDNRSLDRAEFDKKIKQKEMMHKRYIEETESARMIEEEKALKQLRRTLVPHARPVPKFDHPFLPQKSSKQVTKPRSPKLQIVKRKERKATTACPYAAVSTAASQMR